MENIIENIRSIARAENVELPEGLSEADSIRYREALQSKFQWTVPDDFIAFLKLCDGIVFRDVNISSAYNIMTYNTPDRGINFAMSVAMLEKFVYLGNAQTTMIVWDKIGKKFALIDDATYEIQSSFESFEELLHKVLDHWIKN